MFAYNNFNILGLIWILEVYNFSFGMLLVTDTLIFNIEKGFYQKVFIYNYTIKTKKQI